MDGWICGLSDRTGVSEDETTELDMNSRCRFAATDDVVADFEGGSDVVTFGVVSNLLFMGHHQ